jgi:uncharacterized protein YndB with AHSA1/START domain
VASVGDSVHVAAPVAVVWRLYFEPASWPAWVDGFGSVESSDGYPERAGTLRWRSTPAGRGTVSERVLEHEPPRLHRIEFSDPESEGELTTAFEAERDPDGGEGTRVSQEVTYRLRDAGFLGSLTEPIFIRPQVARSVRRSLDRLRTEAESAPSR